MMPYDNLQHSTKEYLKDGCKVRMPKIRMLAKKERTTNKHNIEANKAMIDA